MSRRRRLVSAQLTDRDDQDLLPWVDELVQTGLLSIAVREGLRLVRELDRDSESRALWRSGLLARAIQSGVFPGLLVRRSSPSESPVPYSQAVQTQGAERSGSVGGVDLEGNLDSILEGL